MIKSFADKETELIYKQEFSRRLPNTIQKVALRKLMLIDNAKGLEDLLWETGKGSILSV